MHTDQPSFGFPSRTRRAVVRTSSLLLSDVAAMAVAFFLCLYLLPMITGPLPAAAVAFSLLTLPVVNLVMGVHGDRGIVNPETLRVRLKSVFICYLNLVVAFAASTSGWQAPVLITAGLAVATPIMLIFEALVRDLLIKANYIGAPTVLIGATTDNIELCRKFKQQPHAGFHPVAFIDSAPAAGWQIDGLPVLPHHAAKAILAAVEVAATTDGEDRTVHDLPVRDLLIVHDLRAEQSLFGRAVDVHGSLGMRLSRPMLSPAQRRAKRALDYVVAVPALLAAMPIMLILCAAIMVASPGSPFYRQKRAGYRGKCIEVLKLRSMHKDGDARLEEHFRTNPAAKTEWERHFKLKNDPRILPVIGKIIRKGSLDELPQLLNIIRGDMSVVGPRPFPDYHMRQFPQWFQTKRLSVPQGLTGLWQISSRSDGDLDVQLAQDHFYIRNWSLWLDIYILTMTLPAVLFAKGAR